MKIKLNNGDIIKGTLTKSHSENLYRIRTDDKSILILSKRFVAGVEE